MKKDYVKKLVGLSALIAIMIVLQFLSTLLSGLSVFPISLVLIPIVLGGAIYGVKGGGILGGAFGIMTFLFCVNGMDKGGQMVFQANGILCFLMVFGKGVLAGILSALTYRAFRGNKPFVAMLCASVVCPVVNTGSFLACMFTFFRGVLHQWAGNTDIALYALTGIVLLNFLPELVINVVFSPAGANIVKAVRKRIR